MYSPLRMWIGLSVAGAVCWAAGAGENRPLSGDDPIPLLRDLLWVWGNPEMGQPGSATLAKFASASPAERARLLGAPNVILAGHGLPPDWAKAEAITREVSQARRIVWEIAMDDASGAPPQIAMSESLDEGRTGSDPEPSTVAPDWPATPPALTSHGPVIKIGQSVLLRFLLRSATWDAAARTTFPGYAQSMARTTSGAILCAHRYPLYSINVSRDGGLNWDAGTVIDYPVWGMGTILEVEPDVVLCTYMNAERSLPLLAQLIRVTPRHIEPVYR